MHLKPLKPSAHPKKHCTTPQSPDDIRFKITMSSASGFDKSPPLEPNNADHADQWSRFIAAVLGHHGDDPHPANTEPPLFPIGFIESNLGEHHPLLPHDGSEFPPFSSQVSSGSPSTQREAMSVIRQMYGIAKENFGDRDSPFGTRAPPSTGTMLTGSGGRCINPRRRASRSRPIGPKRVRKPGPGSQTSAVKADTASEAEGSQSEKQAQGLD